MSCDRCLNIAGGLSYLVGGDVEGALLVPLQYFRLLLLDGHSGFLWVGYGWRGGRQLELSCGDRVEVVLGELFGKDGIGEDWDNWHGVPS